MTPMGRAPPEDDSPPPPGPALKKGPWSATEDRILMEYVRDHGEGNWNAVQRNTPLHRCGKSCRLRWANHLRPNLKKGAFSPDEERLIIDLHSRLGNKWARISAHLPGRTDNEVKNYWNTRVKRRLRQGLPLYPLNNSHHNHNHQSPPPPPQPLTPAPAPPLPVLKPPPFLDPTSLPFPAPFFSFHHLPNYNTTPAFPTRSSLPGPFGFDSLKSEPVGLGFDYNKLELPSNQFCPNLAPNEDDDDQDVDDENVYDYEAIDEVKFYPNSTGERGNSGLLDALLQEAQTRAEATRRRSTFKKEGSDGDRHWDSIYANSSSDKGAPKTEEQDDHMYYTNEDLSSILNLIPSLVTAPKWDGRHQDASAGQSSNISDENAGLEMPRFPQVSSDTEWLNSSAGSYTSWDNLPRIC